MLNEFNFLFNNENINISFDANGVAWFRAYEIAKLLGYSDAHNMIKNLPDTERSVQLGRTFGGLQQIAVINEYGLYRIIMRANSRHPQIQDFQNKVFYDILPCIRKYGAYIDSNTRIQLEQNPNLIHDINANIDNHEKKRMYHLIYPDSTEYRNIQKIRELQTDNRDLRRYNNKAKIMYQNLQDSYDHLQDLLSDPSDLSNFD